MKYLVDTNALSEPFRQSPNPSFMQRLRRHEGEIATAATVWHELWHGWARMATSRRKALLQRYLEGLQEDLVVLPYDERAARWHAEQRARLHRRTPPYEDGLIAAVAAVNDLVVVTANVSDFSMFPIRVENWMGA